MKRNKNQAEQSIKKKIGTTTVVYIGQEQAIRCSKGHNHIIKKTIEKLTLILVVIKV